VEDRIVMIVTNKKLQKYGIGDHREDARIALARLEVGEEFYWMECKKAVLAAQARQMVSRWNLDMVFRHERHKCGGFLIIRIA